MRWSRRDVLNAACTKAALAGVAFAAFAPVSAQALLWQPDQAQPLPAPMRKRLVCIGGTITEILYDLDCEAMIVGVDSTSNYPAQALREKENIGYMRQISPEGVLSLNPSAVLVMRDAGPKAALEQIARSPVPMIYVDATATASAVIARIKFLGTLLDAQTKTALLTANVQQGFTQLANFTASQRIRPRVMFVLMVAGNQVMVGGKGTAADEIIRLAGGENAAAASQGYQMIGAESVISMAPQMVLTMRNAGVPLPETLLKTGGFRETPAGKKNALIAMDGELLLGFGPRTPQAGLDLARSLQAMVV